MTSAGPDAAGAHERAPWWDAPDPAGWRVTLPALAALVVQVAAALHGSPREWVAPLLRGDLSWAAVEFGGTLLVAVAGPLLLLAARVAPGPVVTAVTGVTLLDVVLADRGERLPIAALAVAIVSAVVRGARVWAWLSVATGLVVTLLLSPLFTDQLTVAQVGFATVLLIAAFGAGELLRAARTRRVTERERTERRRDTALRAERERIARELHDVLAHSLSQISVQAGVGLHLSGPGRPEALARAREALGNIREASTVALDDVRAVIGVLRSPGDAPLAPEPGLERLDQLAGVARDAGLRVEMTTDAAGSPPRPAQAAAFRIVQEAVTNALRHAEATSLAITVATRDGALEVEVVDDGVASPERNGTSARGAGLGLAGMAERAALLGGTLEAGPRSGGGWRVAARLPTRSDTGA